MDRFKSVWFKKRASSHYNFSKFFINIIQDHKSKKFALTHWDLKQLPYYDLAELAVAVVNKKLCVSHEQNHDFPFMIDKKCAVVRTHSYGRRYSASIPGCANKKRIMATVYEPVTNKFYFFAFENSTGKDEFSIPFEPVTGQPKLTNYMWCYEVPDFRTMAHYFTK